MFARKQKHFFCRADKSLSHPVISLKAVFLKIVIPLAYALISEILVSCQLITDSTLDATIKKLNLIRIWV